MPKKEVEELYDQYAKEYATGGLDEALSTTDNSRTAMSFADDITWYFMLKYAPEQKDALILDAGAGDGYWTERFIETGYKNFVLTDISQGMLNEAKERLSKINDEFKIKFLKSDIVDMKELESDMFDYVFSQYDPVSLCMEPEKAIQELARVGKKGTHIVVCLDTKFRRVPELIEAGKLVEAEELLKTNISYDFTHPQYNLTWEELADYFENAGLEVMEVVGAPVFVHQIREEKLEQMEKKTELRKRLLEIELEYCTNRSLVNFAGHLQMIGKKK